MILTMRMKMMKKKKMWTKIERIYGNLGHLQLCSVSDPATKKIHIQVLLLKFLQPHEQIINGGVLNSKPSGPIIIMGQSETLTAVISNLLQSFVQLNTVAAPFTRPLQRVHHCKECIITSHCKECNDAEPKPLS